MLRVYIYHYFIAYIPLLIKINPRNFVMNKCCSRTFVSNRLAIRIGDLFLYCAISTHPVT